MSSARLPEGFAELDHLVDDWSLATAFDRDAARGSSSPEERQALYDAFTPRLADALDLLDQTPLEQHDDAAKHLMRMALSYAHVAQAIEVHGTDELKHARQRQRIPITRATADL